MLDSPGLIPPRLSDPDSALMLAICNNIGMASYDNQVVAAAMVDKLVEVANQVKVKSVLADVTDHPHHYWLITLCSAQVMLTLRF